VSEHTDAERLDAIQARADAATEGPWEWEGDYPSGHCPHDTEWTDHGPDLVIVAKLPADKYGVEPVADVITSSGYDASSLTIRDADAEFIAHAREDVPFLLARVRELEAKVTAHDRLGTIGTLAADIMTVSQGWIGQAEAKTLAKGAQGQGLDYQERTKGQGGTVSDAWEDAIEAGAEAVATEDGDDEIYPYHEHEAAQVIRAALPHLRRHIIAELAAEAERESGKYGDAFKVHMAWMAARWLAAQEATDA
jgi:hypothetical protein